MKKLMLMIALGALILIVAAGVAFALILDSAVKKGIEVAGPQIAKVPVSLDGVRISVLSGNGTVRGLKVGNPRGYKAENSILLDRANVSLKVGSVLGEKVIIHSITIDSPEIFLEGGLKDNNLTKILANIDQSLGGSSKTASTPPADQPAGKKLQIDEFVLNNAKVHVALTSMSSKSLTLNLPSVRVSGLGADTDGVTPAEAASTIFQAVVGDTTKAVAGSIGQLGKEVLDSAKDIGQDAGKTAVDAASKAVKGVKDLFRKK